MVTPTVKRLHHNGFPIKDHYKTREFYEGIIGMPLVAAWAEQAEVLGKPRSFMHTFYELADGSALAFFQVATPDDPDYNLTRRTTLLDHIALSVDDASQQEIKRRLEAGGYPATIIDHGYVKSLYTCDPDGLYLEFSVDPDDVAEIAAAKRASVDADLRKWMEGDHSPNNDIRHGQHDAAAGAGGHAIPSGANPFTGK